MNLDPRYTSTFAVIIPTYNRACIVEQAIQSVLLQTFTDWELVIVDDGSTDDTILHVKPFCYDKRIKCVRLENNCGVSYARNVGVDETNSQLLAFLDSDCLWKPEYLETMHGLLSNPEIDVAISMIEGLRWDSETDTYTKLDTRWIYLPWKLYHTQNRYMWIGPSQCCMRRDKFLEIGGYNLEIDNGEDAELWGRLYVSGCSFSYYPHPLVTHRLHKDSAQLTIPSLSEEEHLKIQDKRKAAREVGGPRRLYWQELHEKIEGTPDV